jgi:hypothetical protein
MNRLATAAFLGLGLGWPSIGLAETFTVKATVLCPAFHQVFQGVTIPDPNLGETVQEMIPCPGIKVVARDADSGPDDDCGEGFTDLSGKAEFEASCGDPGDNKPDVYIEAHAKSSHGWGIRQYDGLEAGLLAAAAIVTLGASTAIGDIDDLVTQGDRYKIRFPLQQKHPSNNGTLNYGTVSFGSVGPTRSRPMFVGTLFFLSDLTERTMRAIGYETPLLDQTNWVVDSIAGHPTTIWNDIVIDASVRDTCGSDALQALRSAAHELGHVFHNKRHSGQTHWLSADANEYLQFHEHCSQTNAKMAWYEGFANLVRDIVYDAASTVSNGTVGGAGPDSAYLQHKSLWDPFHVERAADECIRSTEIEGDVEAILVDLYFGQYTTQSISSSGLVTSTRLQSDLVTHVTEAEPLCGGPFVQMPTWTPKEMMDLVKVARDAKESHRIPDNHTIYNYWYAGAYPVTRCNGQYCGSKTFSTRSAMVLPEPIGFEAVASNCGSPGPHPVHAPAVNPPPAPDTKISLAEEKRLVTELKRRIKKRTDSVPLKKAFTKADVQDQPDWYEQGISPEHIADIDLGGSGSPGKARYKVAPHVSRALALQLTRTLGRAPTAAEIGAAIDAQNRKIAKLNSALGKSTDLRKALESHDLKAVEQVEDAILRKELEIKNDGDEAKDPTPLSNTDRRKHRDRITAQLIKAKY